MRSGDFENNPSLGLASMPLTDHLELHHFEDHLRVATAKATTRFRCEADAPEAVSFKAKDRLLLRQLGRAVASHHQKHEVLAVMNAPPRARHAVRRAASFLFYPAHRSFTLAAKPRPDEDEKAAVAI